MEMIFPRKAFDVTWQHSTEKSLEIRLICILLYFLKIFHAEDNRIMLIKLVSPVVYHKILFVYVYMQLGKFLSSLNMI
jgi:hypothetical protein